MKRTASDVLVDTIRAWGVEVIFGLPGDGMNGIMEALRKRPDAYRIGIDLYAAAHHGSTTPFAAWKRKRSLSFEDAGGNEGLE